MEKNHLRATKTLNIEAFNTHEEFDDYLDQIRNWWEKYITLDGRITER